MDVSQLLCCPACHATLEDLTCTGCATAFGRVGAVPLLIAGADPAHHDLRDDARHLEGHDSTGLGIVPIAEALERGDLILELGAGRETTTTDRIVRTDAFVFADAHLDVAADAHALPFADATFDFVFSLAVFEHIHSPWLVAKEMARVLKPGGRAYTLCAFMQPLHGYPDHYFNPTESGLRHLFEADFDIELCGPSRHSSFRQAVLPLYRMREMSEAHGRAVQADLRTRWRRRRLERALATATHQLQQLGDRMIDEAPEAYEAWRTFAPAVELLGRRR